MNTILILLAILALPFLTAFAALIFIIVWVARGESDVNGDPERDAGHTLTERTFPRIILQKTRAMGKSSALHQGFSVEEVFQMTFCVNNKKGRDQ